MLVRAAQHQLDINDYIMAVSVCAKEPVFVCLRQMLCVKDNPADYRREICCRSWEQPSLCVWHALPLVLPLTQLNKHTYAQRIVTFRYRTGMWVVRSQRSQHPPTEPVLVGLSLFTRETSRCNFQWCQHLHRHISHTVYSSGGAAPHSKKCFIIEHRL